MHKRNHIFYRFDRACTWNCIKYKNIVKMCIRDSAKAVNFGIIYGLSAFGLSQDLKISRKQAQEYIDRYFAMYPRVKEFLDGEVEKGKTDGYVKTMFNRIRPIPELKSSNFMQRNFGERVAMNSPIPVSYTHLDVYKRQV